MPTKTNKSNGNYVPTLEEYIAEQINLTRNAALNKSLTRTMPRVPKGIKRGEQWNRVTQKVEPIYENGNSCAYTFADNYGLNFTSSEDFRQNHKKYGFKQTNWENRKAGDGVLVLGDDNVAKHTMMYDSDNNQGQPLYNHSNGGDNEYAIRKKARYPLDNSKRLIYTYTGTPQDSTAWTNEYKQLYGNRMKCGGRRKAQLGLDIQYGGRAIPIGKNMVYFDGNSHAAGGIGVGNDLEVEGGEVGERKGNSLRVFSAVPFLRGVSPAQLVMGGANPDKVFKAQENFKDRNRINDDGTTYKNGGKHKALIGTEEGIKDNTYVAPINVEQTFIPFTGVKKVLYDSVPKNAVGQRLASGAINIVSPEFDLLTGVRGLANMVRPKTYKSIINNTDYTPAISELDNAANQGIQMGRDYINNPIVQATTEHNRQLYKRLFGKPQNMIYIDDTGKKVLAKQRGELLSTSLEEPVKYKFSKLPDKEAGSYIRSKDGVGNITIAEGLSPIKTKNTAFHETLHHARYGNFDGIIYDLKAEKLFPNNSYLMAGHEAAANTAEVGRDMGLAIGQKYPGMKVFKEMISKLPKPYYKDVVINSAKLDTPRDYKRFWDALTGKYFTTAGSIVTGVNLTNTNKKKFGGSMIYTINGNVKNGLMSARPKAQYGKTIKINRDSYETVDEAVERYKQLYRIRYGKEPSKADVNRVAWVKTLETAIAGDPNLVTGYGPNVGVRGPNVTKIVSGANKGRQIARTQTAVRNKNVKSATQQRQAINTKVSQAARNERLSQFERWQQGEAFEASTMPTDAVTVNRQPISTGVRSGRKGRVDDVVAIERSQRGVDPLSSKSEFSVYDKAYAKKANNKMNQFASALLASGTGGIIAGSIAYNDIVGDTIYDNKQSKEKQFNLNTNSNIDKSINPNIKVKSNSSSTTKVNNKNTNNDYVSTTKPNTGESYVINPLTGEWIRNGVTETSEPSVKGTTKVSSSTSSAPRGRGTQSSKTTASTKPVNVEAKQPKLVERPKENLYITGIKNNAVKSPLMIGMEKISVKPASSSTGDGTQLKEGRWIGQYKSTTPGDWIGLGANVLGSIGSYFITKSAIDKLPKPVRPALYQAAKLKTNYNINPQLTELREAEQVNREAVRRNTQSSNTSLAREQRLMNKSRNERNILYGQKENIETQLINQDKLNRQQVAAQNIAAYNDYLNRIYANKVTQNQAKVSNVNNLISGLTGGVNSILGSIESRRMTNNTLRAIAAANPNVDARLIGGFDYYIDPVSKKKYNKNQQYVGTIND